MLDACADRGAGLRRRARLHARGVRVPRRAGPADGAALDRRDRDQHRHRHAGDGRRAGRGGAADPRRGSSRSICRSAAPPSATGLARNRAAVERVVPGVAGLIDWRIGESHAVLDALIAEGRQADFVFIDGGHSEAIVRGDWTRALALRPRVIVLHDTVHLADVARVVEELSARYPSVTISYPRRGATAGEGRRRPGARCVRSRLHDLHEPRARREARAQAAHAVNGRPRTSRLGAAARSHRHAGPGPPRRAAGGRRAAAAARTGDRPQRPQRRLRRRGLPRADADGRGVQPRPADRGRRAAPLHAGRVEPARRQGAADRSPARAAAVVAPVVGREPRLARSGIRRTRACSSWSSSPRTPGSAAPPATGS